MSHVPPETQTPFDVSHLTQNLSPENLAQMVREKAEVNDAYNQQRARGNAQNIFDEAQTQARIRTGISNRRRISEGIIFTGLYTAAHLIHSEHLIPGVIIGAGSIGAAVTEIHLRKIENKITNNS